ncbi:MAG: hydroxymethylbilane synthase [Alphaproteobacteria bacterium]|nr:hydroxymethylbilane synthase [Alphaproteobacteria bacterium]
MKKIILGTRGSPLARLQTDMVCAGLRAHWPDLEIAVRIITTSGDWKPQDGETRLNTQQGGKGLFAKEIEEVLLRGEIDAAVHSMKDMPAVLPAGLQIKHMLPREDVRDAVLLGPRLKGLRTIADFPSDTIIGTASVRRQAFVLARRPDLKVVPLRGNVQTRIDKLAAGQVDATFLALAGLKRLNLDHHADFILQADEFLPSAGQGAIGIETGIAHAPIAALFDPLTCMQTVLCVAAERAALGALDGSCHTPIGAYAQRAGHQLRLRLAVAALDGSKIYEHAAEQAVVDEAQAKEFGAAQASILRRRLPHGLLQQVA